MTKRVAAGLLWFYAGWCVGATIAFELDLSEALGPIFGTALAAIIAGDPRRIIWTRGRVASDPNGGSQVHVPA